MACAWTEKVSPMLLVGSKWLLIFNIIIIIIYIYTVAKANDNTA